MGKKGRRDKPKERRQPSTSSSVTVNDVIKLLVFLLPLYFLLACTFDWRGFFKLGSSSPPSHKKDSFFFLHFPSSSAPSSSDVGAKIELDILDPLNSASIGVIDYARMKWLPDVFGQAENHPERFNNDFVVNNFYSDNTSSNNGGSGEQNAKRPPMIELSTSSKKLRSGNESPTCSPTKRCNERDYQPHRDPSAIDIQLSPTRAYASIRAYRQLYQRAALDMRAIVANTQPSLMYNPNNDVVDINDMAEVMSDCDVPTTEPTLPPSADPTLEDDSTSSGGGIDRYSWKNLESTTERVIYGRVNADTLDLQYVGYSSDYGQRLEYYKRDYDDRFFQENEFVRLLSYDTIPHEIDSELSDRLIQFWNDMLAIRGLPPTLRFMYENLLEQWHRGGPKVQYSAMLIETGTQLHYGLDSASEFMMYDENKETSLRRLAYQTAQMMNAEIDNVWGVDGFVGPHEPFCVNTWGTGAQDDRFTSCEVVVRYVMGNLNRANTHPAIFPNARTEAGIFAQPETDDELELALYNFRRHIQPYAWNSHMRSFVVVDAQHYLFKSLIPPQMELCRMGYEKRKTFLGGEIILFRKGQSLVWLIGHPALVCDSQDDVLVEKRQRRAVAMDALRLARQRAINERPQNEYAAIRGSIIAEISDRGWHGSLRFGAALCRDTMTDTFGVDALSTFGGPTHTGMTPDNIHYPTSRAARDREVNPKISMQRFTDELSQGGIESTVDWLDEYMQNNNWPNHSIYRKWRSVISWYQCHEDLQGQLTAVIRALPSGGDQAPLGISIARNDELRAAIRAYFDQHRSIESFRFFLVKNGESFNGADFRGVGVYDLNTPTNARTKLPQIIHSFMKYGGSLKDIAKAARMLGTGRSVSNVLENEYFQTLQRLGINHIDVPDSIALYKLVPVDRV